jgi:hypothetical protein
MLTIANKHQQAPTSIDNRQYPNLRDFFVLTFSCVGNSAGNLPVPHFLDQEPARLCVECSIVAAPN